MARQHASQARRRLRGERGAAAIEFGLLLPVLILLIFGIIEFSRAYNTKVQLTHAAREGARAVAVGSGSATSGVNNALSGISGVSVNGPSSCTAGENVTVTVSYVHPLSIPLWGDVDVNLDAKGVMRCAG